MISARETPILNDWEKIQIINWMLLRISWSTQGNVVDYQELIKWCDENIHIRTLPAYLIFRLQATLIRRKTEREFWKIYQGLLLRSGKERQIIQRIIGKELPLLPDRDEFSEEELTLQEKKILYHKIILGLFILELYALLWVKKEDTHKILVWVSWKIHSLIDSLTEE